MRLNNGEALEPVFATWLPSERVQGLSEDQVKDIRQRLNVTIQIADGQPAVPAPIESFQEMVRFMSLRSLRSIELLTRVLLLEDPARQHQRRHHAPQVPDAHSDPGARDTDCAQRP